MRNEYLLSNKERKIIRASKTILWKYQKKITREARNRYRESSYKKTIKREHGRNRHQNMSGEDKQRLKEYQKEIIVEQENQHKNFILFCLHRIKCKKKPWILVTKVSIKLFFIKTNI